MFGINGSELLVLLLLAVLVVGPERLPAYAEQLGRWARSARSYVGTAKERVASELGEEGADVDWASLDPRRYDPRRIVREALLDEPPSAPRRTGASPGGAGSRVPAEGPAPFDDEAT